VRILRWSAGTCARSNAGTACRAAGGTRPSIPAYHDVRYRRWSTVVELDGRAAHPVEEAFRDFRRDNRVVVAGDVVLRYGWRDVACHPCEVAAQVAEVLQARGWPGPPRVCGSGCPVNPAA
jgi:hypothetical protein